MFAKAANPVEAWVEPATEAFEFWVSLWPTAPLFGVQWRFADAVPFTSVAIETAVFPSDAEVAAKPVAKVQPVAKVTAMAKVKPAVKVAPVAEIKPVVEAKPMAKVEPVIEVKPVVEIKPVAKVESAVEAKTELVTGKPASLLAKAPRNADDLTLIKGIGPGIAQQLNRLGVYKFAQIAEFSEAELAWVDDNLTSLKGRCFRDNWIAQAKTLLG